MMGRRLTRSVHPPTSDVVCQQLQNMWNNSAQDCIYRRQDHLHGRGCVKIQEMCRLVQRYFQEETGILVINEKKK